MRMRAGDPGTVYCYVFLDGKPVTDCVEADEEGGWVEVYVHGPDGRPFVQRDEIVTERHVGKVAIAFTEAGWADERHR
jgi:hypothetical protein